MYRFFRVCSSSNILQFAEAMCGQQKWIQKSHLCLWFFFDTLFSVLGILIVLCVLYVAEVIGHPTVSLSIAFMSPEI
jgi:hypothetical protein